MSEPYDTIRERVLRLHRPWKLYDKCGHAHEPGDGSKQIEDVGLTCNVLYEICEECCTDGGDYQSERCASEHTHGEGLPICNTAALIAATPQETRFTESEATAAAYYEGRSFVEVTEAHLCAYCCAQYHPRKDTAPQTRDTKRIVAVLDTAIYHLTTGLPLNTAHVDSAKTLLERAKELVAVPNEMVEFAAACADKHHPGQPHFCADCDLYFGPVTRYERLDALIAATPQVTEHDLAEESAHLQAYVCILPIKPKEPIGPNKRRHPLAHREVFLSKLDAQEWAYFQNADEPAPDAVSWTVVEVRVPPLINYVGDTPYIPGACR